MNRPLRFAARGLLRVASSPQTAVVCLLLLCVLVVWGTLDEAARGMNAARERFFGAWVLLAGGIVPLPGVMLVVSVLCVNLSASLVSNMARRWRSSGLVLLHAGVLLLLAGAALTHYTSREATLTLAEGQETDQAAVASGAVKLPIRVRLLDFTVKTYPGSEQAADFQSRLHLVGAGVERDAIVSMNRPLRIAGWTFYQASYAQGPHGEVSTFALVENRGRHLPYVAGIMMVAGVLLHFMLKLTAAGRQGRRP
jgi:hypothetical protein